MSGTGRSWRLPLDVSDDERQPGVVLEIEHDRIPAWCLDLCLLEKELIESLVVRSTASSFVLEIRVDSALPEREVGRVRWEAGRAHVTVTTLEAGNWAHFYLRYYRDSIGAVDHVDVDLDGVKGSKGLFLVLKVPLAVPGRPGEELRQRLGLE